jgi:V/A-type H+/Na+-transporting ATPase subunit I
MIVPMTKYSFLVYHLDYEQFLEKLRELGVVHPVARQQEMTEPVRELFAAHRQIHQIVKGLKIREAEPTGTNTPLVQGKEVVDEVTSLLERQEELARTAAHLRKELTMSLPWGSFDLNTIEALAKRNIHVRFYTCPLRNFKPQWEQEYPLQVLTEQSGLVYFVVIGTHGVEIALEADEMHRTPRSTNEIRVEMTGIDEERKAIEAQLDRHAAESLDAITHYANTIQEEIAYHNTLECTTAEASDRVMVLEGWVPDMAREALDNYLEKQQILHIVTPARKEEQVPVMLKNKRFSKLFEPLGELYSLPVYKELDMTPFFAPFYMLFFGFCLGDAGYGLMMAILSLVMKRRVKGTLKPIMGLLLYLGLSTIFFGIVGIPLYETSLPVYSSLNEYITAQGTDVNQLLFYLALMFGGVQILFGMVLKSINETRQWGWRYAIGTIGWIVLLVGSIVFYLLKTNEAVPAEHLTIPQYALYGISGVMILLLNSPDKNIFMNVGIGLWGTYNMITGLLGDLLSYIRLFALGIASAIMGLVFNSLAVEMSGSIPVLSAIIMVIILIIGHGINLFMSGLGAFVHPLRLTFVEFYKNAGYTGGGKRYDPFKKIN